MKIFLTLLVVLSLLLVSAPDLQAQTLVGDYPFNGNANDMSGNGNHGTVNGAVLTNDRFGNPNSAYAFDGATSQIVIAHSATMTFTGSITVECWAKIDDAYGGVITQHQGGSDGNWLLGVNGGSMKWALSQNGLNPQFDSVKVNDDQWHHLIGVYDATRQIVKHYVDGVLVLSQPETNTPNTKTLPVLIGDENSGGWKLKAVIDDIKIYQGALSLPEYEAFGSGCAGTRGVPMLSGIETPRIGQPFTVLLSHLPLGFPGAIFPTSLSDSQWAGFQLPLDLTPYGMPGCELLVSGDIPAINVAASPLGSVVWGLTIPNIATLVGAQFYNQAFFIDPGANTLGVIMTNGGRGVIGN